jgi:hypothetical protein
LIWSVQDVMLAGQAIREVIRSVPYPSDHSTEELRETVKKRLASWFDAKQRCDAVRVLDENGEEVFRYTGWDLLRDRNKRLA